MRMYDNQMQICKPPRILSNTLRSNAKTYSLAVCWRKEPLESISDRHTTFIKQPSSKLAELGHATPVHSDALHPSLTLQKQTAKRIPEGQIFGEIPLEAAKSYPIQIWAGVGSYTPRIAYADLNTHHEQNYLGVKLLPGGGKTAEHPQIVFFVNGPYHVETLGYTRSDPWKWTTWMEFHLDVKYLKHLIDAVIRAEIALEASQ